MLRSVPCEMTQRESAVLKFTKDSFVRNLAQGRLLVQYLDRYDKYDQPFEFKYSPKTGDDAWHPSGDCLPSVQELYDNATQPMVKNSHSPSLQKAFLVGHFWHQVLQNVLVDMGFAEPSAIERKGKRVWGKDNAGEPKPYHWATGAGDVAPLVLPNWEGILDIKTMNKRGFDRANTTGLLPERFADKYEAQINIYMDLFDQDHGMILAVNKDSPHGFLEFVFDRNQDLIDSIFAKWRLVSDLIDNEDRPFPDGDQNSYATTFDLPFTGPVS